jgi:hypothetical protein
MFHHRKPFTSPKKGRFDQCRFTENSPYGVKKLQSPSAPKTIGDGVWTPKNEPQLCACLKIRDTTHFTTHFGAKMMIHQQLFGHPEDKPIPSRAKAWLLGSAPIR